MPLPDDEMQALVKQCVEEGDNISTISAEQLSEGIKDAKKSLPNFKYRKIENSTAIALLSGAHGDEAPDYEYNENFEISFFQ